jgi:polyphosphate kinase
VGRFLEHSRIFWFENAGRPEIYLASADWMARNFFRRVETCFPVDDQELQNRIAQMIEVYWSDNVKSREQGLELTYLRLPIEGERVDAQAFFLDQASKPRKPEVETKPVIAKLSGKAIDPKQRDEKIGQPV